MSFAVWLTGLSGSGKSAIAKALLAALHARGADAAVLESDVLRTQLTPYPVYSEAERDFFYRSIAAIASFIANERPVVVDATANLRRYRDAARNAIERFAEVHVDTPLAVCEARDPKGLYRAARERAIALPGVNAPYEPPLEPDLIVHGERGSAADSAAGIVRLLESRRWLTP